MNGLEVNPNANRVKRRTDCENLFEYRHTIKIVGNPDVLCQSEFEEMLTLSLILTLFFPI